MEVDHDKEKASVIGVIENRAREVGLAALDLRTASLHLSQFIETSRSYQNTVTLLQYFDPGVILLSTGRFAPESTVGLYNIVDYCIDATKVPLPRKLMYVKTSIHNCRIDGDERSSSLQQIKALAPCKGWAAALTPYRCKIKKNT